MYSPVDQNASLDPKGGIGAWFVQCFVHVSARRTADNDANRNDEEKMYNYNSPGFSEETGHVRFRSCGLTHDPR